MWDQYFLNQCRDPDSQPHHLDAHLMHHITRLVALKRDSTTCWSIWDILGVRWVDFGCLWRQNLDLCPEEIINLIIITKIRRSNFRKIADTFIDSHVYNCSNFNQVPSICFRIIIWGTCAGSKPLCPWSSIFCHIFGIELGPCCSQRASSQLCSVPWLCVTFDSLGLICPSLVVNCPGSSFLDIVAGILWR